MDLVSSIRKSGSRGGVNFNWEDVASSTHRENYLGHSLKAPVGRWQKGRDLEWYAKNEAAGDGPEGETEEERAARGRREEIKKIKEAEEDALARALGLPVAVRNQTGANAVELPNPRIGPQENQDEEPKAKTQDDDTKEAKKHRRHGDSERRHRRRHRSRSRSRDRRRDRSPRRREDPDSHKSRDDRRDRERRRDHSHDRSARSPKRRDDAGSHRPHNDRHRRRSYSRERDSNRRGHTEANTSSRGEVVSRRGAGDEQKARSRDRQRSRSPDDRRRRAPSP